MRHYTPKAQQQSKFWIDAAGSTLKKAETVISEGKAFATFCGKHIRRCLQTIQNKANASPESIMVNYRTVRIRLRLNVHIFRIKDSFVRITHLHAKLNEGPFKMFPYKPYSRDGTRNDHLHLTNLKKWLVG